MEVRQLNALYEQLQQEGLRNNDRAVLKENIDLKKLIKSDFSNREIFTAHANISYATVMKAIKGAPVELACGEKIAAALNLPVSKIFNIVKDEKPLSMKTVREHHMLIDVILHEAEREMLVPYNAAEKAKPPKANKSKAQYFDVEQVAAILEAAEREPIKWKLLIHLMLVTGGRRGEILGLRWSEIDWSFNQIHIENCIYYEADRGIYFDIPKTEKSTRYLKLPAETINMLKEYQAFYNNLKQNFGNLWLNKINIPNGKGEMQTLDNDFLFVQENRRISYPMHPDTLTSYCEEFAEKNGLPHIYPHKFRHTAASLLY